MQILKCALGKHSDLVARANDLYEDFFIKMMNQEKPTAAFALSLVGAVMILISGIVVALAAAAVGALIGLIPGGGGLGALVVVLGALGLIFGILALYGAIMINSGDPGKVRTGSTLVLISSILGGLFTFFTVLGILGLVLGLVGSILGLTWKPSFPIPPVPSPTPSPASLPPSGTVTRAVQPGTVTITHPGGGTITVSAWLQAPGGALPITSLPQTFGRDDFRNLVSPQLLDTISRRHFTIGYDYVNGQFVIWDEGSRNGTYVNGVDIRGKGPVPLKYGDVIAPANAIQLKFALSAV